MNVLLVILAIMFIIVILIPWLSLIDIGTIAKELSTIRRLMEEQKK